MAVPWSSLRFRLIAAAAVGLALGLLVAGGLLVSVYRESVIRSFDVRLEALARILVANAEIDPDGGLILRYDLGEPLFETAYSGWYWQISSPATSQHPSAILKRSRSLFDADLPAGTGGPGGKGFTTGPRGERLRSVSMRVMLPSSPTPYNVVVAGNYDEVLAQIASYLGTLGVALGLLAIGIMVALWLQVRFALSPMRRVRVALAAVRDGSATTLTGQFPAEVEPLITELNGLLAHNSAVLERARTQVGNLAHALKTPLSILRNEVNADEAHLRDAVRRESETMRRQVDHYLARARAAAAANVLSSRTEVLPRAMALVRTMVKLHASRGIAFDLDCPPGIAFRGETEDLDEILGNLLDNGGKWAKSRVAMMVRMAPNRCVSIIIEDDGPGIDTAGRDAVRERGQRLDESVPGTGLGLSIVRDLVALYGGVFALEQASKGGLRARLTLPAAGLA
jgi:signal transduction histidine kinase